jgi:TDG/mug DNA glycosylase family protein
MSHEAGATLPDLLRHGLELVFVGINPSVYSVAQGHYFARRINRFWPCLSRSTLSWPVREALGVDRLEPVHDTLLPAHGIGFTDVVKRATAKAVELDRAEFAAGAAELAAKLEHYAPRVACFQGMMGYRPFAAVLGAAVPGAGVPGAAVPGAGVPGPAVLGAAVPGAAPPTLTLGEQPLILGRTRVFVVPSPSSANAHFTPAQQTEWYDRLAAYLAAPDPAA